MILQIFVQKVLKVIVVFQLKCNNRVTNHCLPHSDCQTCFTLYRSNIPSYCGPTQKRVNPPPVAQTMKSIFEFQNKLVDRDRYRMQNIQLRERIGDAPPFEENSKYFCPKPKKEANSEKNTKKITFLSMLSLDRKPLRPQLHLFLN